MILKKLRLKNVRSYENLEIDFPRGNVLLAGDIGAGKTSILLGLQFALFGLQPGQKGSSILRQGEDSAYAHLELEVDGELIALERTIKKSKSGGISQDRNVLTMKGQQEELSTSEMKDRVVRLLNYPKEFIKKSNLLYKFTVYTPQEEMKEIIQERPEVRLDTLRHIFGIDRYKRIKDNTAILLQKVKESIKLKEVMVSELNLLKERFTSEKEKKILLAREVNNLDIEYNRLARSKREVEEKLSAIQKKLEEKRKLNSELANLEVLVQGKKDLEARLKKEIVSMHSQLREEIDFSEERLRAVAELLSKHKHILEDRNNLFMDVNSKISVLESKKEEPMKLREKVMSIENCPTCFQTVGHEHKDKIFKRTQFDIEEVNRELESRLLEREKLLKEIESEKKLVEEYEGDRNILQQNKIKFEHRREIETKIKSESFVLDRTSNEVGELNSKIEFLKIRLKEFEEFEEISEKIGKEYKEAERASREKEVLLATKKKELEILGLRLEELQEEIVLKEEIRNRINYLRGLQDWLGEKFISVINLAEKNVMAKLRSEFSKIFSDWFSMLVEKALSVRLDADFTPIVTNQDYEIDYDFLSGGERTAVALAYRLALNQVLNSMLSSIKTKDLVILDEPTDGFASEQIDKMRDIFEQLRAEQVILVSHEEKIEGFVDHIIRVRKEGVSRVGE